MSTAKFDQLHDYLAARGVNLYEYTFRWSPETGWLDISFHTDPYIKDPEHLRLRQNLKRAFNFKPKGWDSCKYLQDTVDLGDLTIRVEITGAVVCNITRTEEVVTKLTEEERLHRLNELDRIHHELESNSKVVLKHHFSCEEKA